MFHDRENEISKILGILSTRPDLIVFVYGPINSGKTELFQYLIERLPADFIVFYINLRGRFISGYEDFIDVLFEIDEKRFESLAEYVSSIAKDLKILTGLPIPTNLFEKITEKKRGKDVFKYIESLMTELSKKKKPILIIDELQVVGDLKIDDLLIYKLFNLFVRLTKELHVCHVFAITSDSLFIEKICNEAMLHGRAEYVLVDDFDRPTAESFLRKNGFDEDEIELIWHYFGGKPIYLVRAVQAKKIGEDLRELVDRFYQMRLSQIKDAIYELEERDKDLFDRVLDLFGIFKDREILSYEKLSKEILFCVKNNILFVDPVRRIAKPQSHLDLLAMKEIA